MQEAGVKKRVSFNIYDYVSNLEEELKALHTEKTLFNERTVRLESELIKAKTELAKTRVPPLAIGTVQELVDEETAIVRNTNAMEFLVKITRDILDEVEVGTRVAMNQRSLSIVKTLPELQDTRVRAMEVIEKPSVTFSDIGGLEKEIIELEEAVILPLTKPEKFKDLGITPPSGILLYGEPGTGKTLLAKAVANKSKSTFISVTGSELVRKYIGEGSRLVRDVFNLASEKKPAIIFIDEIDAIAAQRFATSNGDREVQRTLMQLLSELDGFKQRENVKIIAATNRIDMLDPALLRPGRFDRVIEVPMPNPKARQTIFAIHCSRMNLAKDVSVEEMAGLTETATGADIKAVCMEAGMLALRQDKNRIEKQDFEQAIEKVLGDDGDDDTDKDRMYS